MSAVILDIWRFSEPLVIGALLGCFGTALFFLGYGTKQLKKKFKKPIKAATDEELLS